MSGLLPLSALRTKLDAGSATARWLTDADGVLGRSLEVAADTAVTYPLALGGGVSFTARAMLLPHDWRDGRGALRAAVLVTHGDGRREELWSAMVRTGDRGSPSGAELSVQVPADARALHLEVRRHAPGTVARLIWVKPALSDPSASPVPGPAEGAVPAPAPREPVVERGEPLFSVLVPVHDPPLHMLQEAVQSVRDQSFDDWQLCLVDDGSRRSEVIGALDAYAAQDARIVLQRHDIPGGISSATNAALAIATGRYIALLDHDDTLEPDALQTVADRIAGDPALDMVYTDEDIVDGGRPVWVHLKPGWSPDTLRTNGYTCHLGVYRRSLVNEIGGFRSAFDGSQDIDMILRLIERSERIAHIPRVLYHWRLHAASTAGGDAKPYAYVAARNAYAAHLERIGVPARVDFGPPGLYRVDAAVDPGTSVAFVLALRSLDGLEAALDSWAAQPHPTWSVSIAAPESLHDGITELFGERSAPVTLTTGTRHDAATAAANAGAEHLLLMHTPAAGLTEDWLIRLIGYSSQPGIAAAGPVVLSPDGRIAHAGVALPEGIPLYLLHGSRSSMDEFFGYGTSVHNVSAVSGALLTPAGTYGQLGGLDDAADELALIEYCLRAGDDGRRIVTVPDARLRLTGPDLAVNDLPAIWRLRREWAAGEAHDPFYNAGYRTDRGDFRRRPA